MFKEGIQKTAIRDGNFYTGLVTESNNINTTLRLPDGKEDTFPNGDVFETINDAVEEYIFLLNNN